MPENQLTYEDLLQVMEVIKASERFSEVKVKVGGMELALRRGAAGPEAPRAPSPSAVPATPAASAPAAQAAPAARPPRAEETFPEDAVPIRSPMVGVFYRAPEPGAKPFVEVGQSVEPDTVVCLIEVMKLFNSISAGCRGTVTRILASNAEAVDHEQVLMVVEPR